MDRGHPGGRRTQPPGHAAAGQAGGVASFTYVPYKGTQPALMDVAGGHVDLLLDSMISLLPLAKAGKVRPIAITSARRSALTPDVPTVQESGLPNFAYASWYGVWAPKDTPADRVAVLNAAINAAIAGAGQVGRPDAQPGHRAGRRNGGAVQAPSSPTTSRTAPRCSDRPASGRSERGTALRGRPARWHHDGMHTNRRHLLLAGVAALPLSARSQSAAKPIRLIVPYPPGGPLDIAARALADKVKDSLGTVVVENRPGAGGNIGADLAAKAAPDGTTIVMGAVATHAINPWLYGKMPYDALADFTPITLVAQVPNVLVMNAETASRLGIGSLRDLVSYMKANPAKLNYGSGGNGSAGHLAGEMFKTQAGVFMVHIPYAGGAGAQFGLLSDQVRAELRQPGRRVGEHQERQAEGAGRDDREALERDARRADGGRGRSRPRPGAVRHPHLVRPVRTRAWRPTRRHA